MSTASLRGDVVSILYESNSPVTLPNVTTFTANDYVTFWNGLGAPNRSVSVSSFTGLNNQSTLGGPNSNIAFHAVIQVNASTAANWFLEFGIDYGFGGAAFVDGNLLDFRTSNMWWSGSFADTAQMLSGTANLTAGSHTIEVFGLEDCCDGLTEARYRIGTGPATIFTTATPEPASIASMALGLGLIVWRVQRRKKASV